LFIEDSDILEQRKEARKTIGVHEESMDFNEINQIYKKLSKEYHPDRPNGDTIMFQKINHAHKVLKKELSD
jgi:curved DNA-binding protein CbpA